MKKVNTGGFVIMSILLFVVLGIVIVAYIYFANNPREQVTEMNNPSTESRNGFKEFKSSDVLDFSIKVPNHYRIEEKYTSVVFSNDMDQLISISMNGTNFDNLNDYIINHQNDLNGRLTNREIKIINSNETVVGFIDDEKIYFVYVNNTVYNLSTSSEALYDDLDQIAQSFRYTPN